MSDTLGGQAASLAEILHLDLVAVVGEHFCSADGRLTGLNPELCWTSALVSGCEALARFSWRSEDVRMSVVVGTAPTETRTGRLKRMEAKKKNKTEMT